MLGKFPELALLVRARDRARLGGGGVVTLVLCLFVTSWAQRSHPGPGSVREPLTEALKVLDVPGLCP